MRYLIDTDWVIDALANMPTAITPLRQLPQDGIAVSMTSIGDLYDGAYGSQAPHAEIARIRQFLSSYPIINLSDAIMDRFAQT
jgi:predicted nucleic acid-binding protein